MATKKIERKKNTKRILVFMVLHDVKIFPRLYTKAKCIIEMPLILMFNKKLCIDVVFTCDWLNTSELYWKLQNR